MWLPLFCERQLDHPRGMAGYLSLMFELGGLLGSPMLGLFADWYVDARVCVGAHSRLLSGRKMLACLVSARSSRVGIGHSARLLHDAALSFSNHVPSPLLLTIFKCPTPLHASYTSFADRSARCQAVPSVAASST